MPSLPFLDCSGGALKLVPAACRYLSGVCRPRKVMLPRIEFPAMLPFPCCFGQRPGNCLKGLPFSAMCRLLHKSNTESFGERKCQCRCSAVSVCKTWGACSRCDLRCGWFHLSLISDRVSADCWGGNVSRNKIARRRWRRNCCPRIWRPKWVKHGLRSAKFGLGSTEVVSRSTSQPTTGH